MEKYNEWKTSTYLDDEDLFELKNISENKKEIEDRFYKTLEFGTGGMRGIIGIGTNRMNKYVVRMATQGFANQIKKDKKDFYSIVISYDNRINSSLFAREAGKVMAANGIKAYVFSSLRTTPELSFAVRELKADGGIMITASHNPPEYNGYKVYDKTGCQVVSKYGDMLVKEVNKIKEFNQIKCMDEEEAIEKNLFQYIDEEIDRKYIDMVKTISRRPNVFKNNDGKFKVMYSPLHGTGGMAVTRTLKELGFSNLHTVKEQMLPDENFSTVKSPNPEDINAFKLGIKYGEENNCNIIIATDPDCDRVGIVVKNKEGQYKALNGNQTGALLLDYILSSYEKLPEKSRIVSTIVSSDIGELISKKYGAKLIQTLTGFKYIGEKIKEFESTGENFIFGYEESYGYLAGTHVRDKDAVISTMLVIEMALFYNEKGINLLEKLDDLFSEYGYFYESLHSITLKGKEGMEKIQYIMNNLRENTPTEIAGLSVVDVMDCLETEKTKLPKSNVLKYILSDKQWIAVRPSGTEPKLKFYFSMTGKTTEEAKEKVEIAKKFMIEKIQ